MYAVNVTVTWNPEPDWERTEQLPTFYLDERVQGIVSERDAELVAAQILRLVPGTKHITAAWVS